MRRIRHALLGAAAAIAMTLTTACEHDQAPPPPPDPSPSEEVLEPGVEDTDATDDGGDAADPDDVTEPGAELSLGETAVVPYQDGVIAVTVTSVEEADQAAFQDEYDADDDLLAYNIWSSPATSTPRRPESRSAGSSTTRPTAATTTTRSPGGSDHDRQLPAAG